MKRTSACGVLVLLLACALLADAARQPVSHTLSREGAEQLRADIAAGAHFPEKQLIIDPNGERTLDICGEDTSAPSDFANVCKLSIQAIDNLNFTCSAWLVAPNKVATAGHCILDALGFAHSVLVMCGGLYKDAIQGVVHPDFYEHVFTNQSSGLHSADAAVITVTDPFPFVPYQLRIAQGCGPLQQLTVTVAGYPAADTPPCHYDGVQQWQSTGGLTCALDPATGLYPSQVDSCTGGAGSRVTDAENFVIGIYVGTVGGKGGACATNLVTRILDGSGLDRASAPGVYIQSLIDTYPN